MPLPKTKAPSPEQRQRLEALLADLAPFIPTGVRVEPDWEPDSEGWTLWVNNHGHVPAPDYDRFVETGHDLAEKRQVAIALIPTEVKDWD